jgi:hypothetical protein
VKVAIIAIIYKKQMQQIIRIDAGYDVWMGRRNIPYCYL